MILLDDKSSWQLPSIIIPDPCQNLKIDTKLPIHSIPFKRIYSSYIIRKIVGDNSQSPHHENPNL
jgi:hypothetical protein